MNFLLMVQKNVADAARKVDFRSEKDTISASTKFSFLIINNIVLSLYDHPSHRDELCTIVASLAIDKM